MANHPRKPDEPFVPSQHPAATIIGKDICVSAGAGCGKTSVLVARLVNLVADHSVPLDRILAITFTDKAANQMKERILAEFERRQWWERRREVNNAPISTIHAFCASLLRQNAFLAGLDPDFVILDANQAALLLRSSLDDVLEEAFAGDAREDMFRLTIALNGEKQLATALISAYNKARSIGLAPSEIKILGAPGADVGARRRLALGDSPSRPYNADVGAQYIAPENDYHAWLAQRFIGLLQRLEDHYRARKDALFALDFDDLQLRTRQLLDFPDLRDELRARFLHILVDEFQDVNPLQDDIIERISTKGNLFIVGDVKQSIYRFRYAEVALFLRRMAEAESRPDAWKISLQLNFRSRKEILDFINLVFSRVWQTTPLPYEQLYFGAHLPPSSQLPRVTILALPPKDQVSSLEQARPLEASFLAQWIRESVEVRKLEVYDSHLQALRPLRYGDVFMLFRSTTNVHLYERALALEGVPYYSASSRGFFQRNEIRDTVAFLKVIDNPYDDLSLVALLRSPWVGASDALLARLVHLAQGGPLLAGLEAVAGDAALPSPEVNPLADFYRYLTDLIRIRNRLSPPDLLRKIVRDNFFEAILLAQPDGLRQLANLRKFHRLVDDLGLAAFGLSDLLHHLEELSVAPVREGEAPLETEGADVVTLMTWHAAKGLEKEMVILPDLSRKFNSQLPGALIDQDGYLGLDFVAPAVAEGESPPGEWPPLEEQRDKEREAERDEEKRILYVAMTRAKEFLVLSGLRPDDMTTCGVSLKDALEAVPPVLVQVLNIPAPESL